MTVGLEPVDSGSTTSAVTIEAYGSFIAAAKRGMYITNELIVLFPIHYLWSWASPVVATVLGIVETDAYLLFKNFHSGI